MQAGQDRSPRVELSLTRKGNVKLRSSDGFGLVGLYSGFRGPLLLCLFLSWLYLSESVDLLHPKSQALVKETI